jgi:hypothetical protein
VDEPEDDDPAEDGAVTLLDTLLDVGLDDGELDDDVFIASGVPKPGTAAAVVATPKPGTRLGPGLAEPDAVAPEPPGVAAGPPGPPPGWLPWLASASFNVEIAIGLAGSSPALRTYRS